MVLRKSSTKGTKKPQPYSPLNFTKRKGYKIEESATAMKSSYLLGINNSQNQIHLPVFDEL